MKLNQAQNKLMAKLHIDLAKNFAVTVLINETNKINNTLNKTIFIMTCGIIFLSLILLSLDYLKKVK
ncbi:MAG: hypothetical protein PVJ09_02305 [Candidatus Woesebacteria bacterium]|jgi:hypothetical protein